MHADFSARILYLTACLDNLVTNAKPNPLTFFPTFFVEGVIYFPRGSTLLIPTPQIFSLVWVKVFYSSWTQHVGITFNMISRKSRTPLNKTDFISILLESYNSVTSGLDVNSMDSREQTSSEMNDPLTVDASGLVHTVKCPNVYLHACYSSTEDLIVNISSLVDFVLCYLEENNMAVASTCIYYISYALQRIEKRF